MARTAKKVKASKMAKRKARNAANAASIKPMRIETIGAKPSGSGTALVTVKAAALSTDVGPRVCAGLFKAYDLEEQAQKMLHEVSAKRYDLLAQTTAAIVKAAKNDDSINLSVVFNAKSEKDKNVLYDQVGLAIGTRSVHTVGKGDKVSKRIGYAPSVAKYFPQPGENKDDPKIKRKDTFRSNFSHLVKKCIQTACAIVDKDLEAEIDKETGTLRISGPAIEKQFGQESVLLNEKKTQENPDAGKKTGKGDEREPENVVLKEKPSFTAIAALADGAATLQRGGTVAHRGTKVTTPEEVVVELCKSLVAALPKVKTHTPALNNAIRSLANAFEKSGLLETFEKAAAA